VLFRSKIKTGTAIAYGVDGYIYAAGLLDKKGSYKDGWLGVYEKKGPLVSYLTYDSLQVKPSDIAVTSNSDIILVGNSAYDFAGFPNKGLWDSAVASFSWKPIQVPEPVVVEDVEPEPEISITKGSLGFEWSELLSWQTIDLVALEKELKSIFKLAASSGISSSMATKLVSASSSISIKEIKTFASQISKVPLSYIPSKFSEMKKLIGDLKEVADSIVYFDFESVDKDAFQKEIATGLNQGFYDSINWTNQDIASLQKANFFGIDWKLVSPASIDSNQYEKIDWQKFNFKDFGESDYNNINWGSVKYNGKKSIKYHQVDWNMVKYDQIFSTKAFKKISWSKINFGDLTPQSYADIKWSSVPFKGKKSVNYWNVKWSLVQFNEFKPKNFKGLDWSKVSVNDLTDTQYSDILWNKVKFKGKKAPKLSELNLSLVIGSSSFSKKNAKQIAWNTISTDDISSSALSKLSGMGVKKKGTNVAELLKPGTQSKELSFAGVGQEQGTALVTPDQAEGALAFVAAASPESLF